MPDASLTGETTELLQSLIRNACVNDGTPESGDETRNADLLQTFSKGPASTSSGTRRCLAEVPWSPGSRVPIRTPRRCA